MAPEEAWAFARQWATAWNEHDIDRVLGHFADNVEFSSPLMNSVLPDSKGKVVGKNALRQYWAAALERFPALHFELLDVYQGVRSLVIRYRNHLGNIVCEYLEFDAAGMVTNGCGCYSVGA